MIKIPLNLENHCLETETRRLYNQSLTRYFKPDADVAGLERRIEILTHALKTLDFPKLRSTYPELAGACKCDAEYQYQADGRDRTTLLIDGKPVKVF